MKTIKVKINKRNLNSLVRKTCFSYGGMFISYGFITIDCRTDKDNTATFYAAKIPTSNSWSNYPGRKIWSNKNCAKYKKSEVLEECVSFLKEQFLIEVAPDFPEVKFVFVGF